MRCFIAIDIDDNIRAALSDLQQQLSRNADMKTAVKWVRPEMIHMTVKFLGEVEDKKIPEVCDIVKKAAAKHKQFELDIKSVGHFGGRIARVLWVGSRDLSNTLIELQKDIEKQLASAGWPEEKREFSGHLTLCRVKDSKAGAKLARISREYKDYTLGTMSVDSVSVYQSQLTPAGPVYTVSGNYKLQGQS